MNIKVKPKNNKTTEIKLADIDGVKDFRVQEMDEVKKDIEQETHIAEQREKNFLTMDIKTLETQLTKFIMATKIIKKKMISGIHYLEINGMEKPIITKQGIAWLSASTNMSVAIKETKEIIKPEINFILYQHEATCSWGNARFVVAQGSANSQEYNQKRKYEEKKSQRSVYDTINDVLQMSQKRAKSQAIREMIAMTDVFETNEDNPLANKRKQLGIYTLFYSHFMKLAKKAPSKTKLKNGKIKTYTEKEKLNWKKDYLKNKYFTPMLYELNITSFGNWGIKDVEKLEKAIPTWIKKNIEVTEYDKKLIKGNKNEINKN